MTKILNYYINGEFVQSRSDRTAEVFNPATGEVESLAPMASASEVEQAIVAAPQALPSWASITPLRRSHVLQKFRVLLEQNSDKLAAVISREHGKTLDDASGEVTRGIEIVGFACGGPHLLKAEVTENVGPSIDSHSFSCTPRCPADRLWVTLRFSDRALSVFCFALKLSCLSSLWRADRSAMAPRAIIFARDQKPDFSDAAGSTISPRPIPPLPR